MNVLGAIKPIARTMETKRTVSEKSLFEEKWKNSISGNEFVRRVHAYIDKLYEQNKR